MARDQEPTGTWTDAAVERGDELRLQRFTVVVEEGPDAGAHATSATERLGVGTHASNELTLSDKT
ncbi:MAG: hypothetical protein LC659_03260, partial [Myxococcales bacterium]|nr:hypothetical protein [Myxococcales bacterium]